MDARRKEHNIAGNFKSIPVKLARMLALAHVYNFAYHACLVDIHYSSGREGLRHDLATAHHIFFVQTAILLSSQFADHKVV